MMRITDRNIEHLLETVSHNNLHDNSFGAVKKTLSADSSLEKQQEGRLEVYFQLKNKPAYSMRVEAKSGSSDFESKGAKFEVHYFARHEITSNDTREVEAIHDLELLFAAANHRSVEYIGGLLKKAGLKWTAGWKNNLTYEGTVSIAGQQASISFDVREVPDDARHPKRKYAEISMRVFPEFRPAPEEKKQSQPNPQYGQLPFFQPAAVKP